MRQVSHLSPLRNETSKPGQKRPLLKKSLQKTRPLGITEPNRLPKHRRPEPSATLHPRPLLLGPACHRRCRQGQPNLQVQHQHKQVQRLKLKKQNQHLPNVPLAPSRAFLAGNQSKLRPFQCNGHSFLPDHLPVPRLPGTMHPRRCLCRRDLLQRRFTPRRPRPRPVHQTGIVKGTVLPGAGCVEIGVDQILWQHSSRDNLCLIGTLLAILLVAYVGLSRHTTIKPGQFLHGAITTYPTTRCLSLATT